MIDDSTGSIILNGNKCVRCRRCVDVCDEVQGVTALVAENRSSDMRVAPAFGEKLATSDCIQCGKCVEVCPTGAFFFKEHIEELLYFTHDYDTTTVVQLCDDIVPQLAELFGMEAAEVELSRIASGLKKVGVDYVLFENRAKSLSLQEGERQLAAKLASSNMPVILTDSRSAATFVRNKFADLDGQLVVYPTSQQTFGSYIRETFIPQHQLEPDNVRIISISDNTERAPEALQTQSVDFCLNARQLYRLFMRTGVDIRQKYQDSNLLNLVNIEETADIPAHSNVLPTVSWSLDQIPLFSDVEFDGKKLSVVTATNLGQLVPLLEKVKQNASEYDVIRIVQ